MIPINLHFIIVLQMNNANTLNRNNPPEFSEKFELPGLSWTTEYLRGTIPVHFINAGSQEVVKIEAGFNSGEWFQTKPKVALACNSLLREGTKSRSSAGISESLDFFGAYLESAISKDFGVVTLFSSNKFLSETLPVFCDVISNPQFPEKEFSIWKQNKIQKLKVDLQKVDFVARNLFSELIFKKNHPYGLITSEKDFSELNPDDLRNFFHFNYLGGIRHIIVSGRVEERVKSLILSGLDKELSAGFVLGANALPESGLLPNTPEKKFVEHEGAIQSAIRIGRPLFSRLHPDYIEFTVLNTILGGYFGSRLMNNIREDKGYTYGIGSGVSSLMKGGQFVISTEVGAGVTQDALKEIYAEIEKLQTQPVGEDELELVKNYMLGNFLRSMDGPFALSERLSSLLDYQLNTDYLKVVIDRIRAATPHRIQTLAQNYLQKEDLSEMVVGKLN